MADIAEIAELTTYSSMQFMEYEGNCATGNKSVLLASASEGMEFKRIRSNSIYIDHSTVYSQFVLVFPP